MHIQSILTPEDFIITKKVGAQNSNSYASLVFLFNFFILCEPVLGEKKCINTEIF